MSGAFFLNTVIGTDSGLRYDMAKFLDFSEGLQDPLTSTFINNLLTLKPAGTYAVRSSAGRPDLLSFRIYRDTQYWWILLKFNSLLHPDDLVEDLVINYPSINDLENLYFSLRSKEVALHGST